MVLSRMYVPIFKNLKHFRRNLPYSNQIPFVTTKPISRVLRIGSFHVEWFVLQHNQIIYYHITNFKTFFVSKNTFFLRFFPLWNGFFEFSWKRLYEHFLQDHESKNLKTISTFPNEKFNQWSKKIYKTAILENPISKWKWKKTRNNILTFLQPSRKYIKANNCKFNKEKTSFKKSLSIRKEFP